MSRLPLRTWLFTTVIDRLSRDSVVGLDLDGIRRARAGFAPTRAPFTWVTGPLHKDVEITDAAFEARDGALVPVRLYHPAGSGPHPLLVYYHGGGWVLGSPRMYDPLCSFVAHAVPAVVVSVDYRMAPEHRAPQAALDCVDALRWTVATAAGLSGHPARVGVWGDSAGGNLAAVVTQVARDEGGPDIAHQALLYPGVDATRSFPSVAEHASGPVLTREKIGVFVAHYLGPDGLGERDPLVSPYWAEDLSGLPPALVQTADRDPLRDEGQAYAERLTEAGVPVRLTNYLGAPHGFMSFPGATTCGAQARDELVREIRAHVIPGGQS